MVPIRGELPRLNAHMDGDDFPPLVEDAHSRDSQRARPGAPHTPVALNNTAAATRCSRLMHGARAFLEHREQTRGNGESLGRSTSLNTLPTCCRVVPWMRGRPTPLSHSARKQILFGQTIEARPLSALFWRTSRPPSILPLLRASPGASATWPCCSAGKTPPPFAFSSGSYQSVRVTDGAQVVNHQRSWAPRQNIGRHFPDTG